MSVMVSASFSSVIARAAQANIQLLAQGADLLQRLGPDRYAVPVKTCFNSSAGGHFRHVIEHGQAVVVGLKTGVIDYEGRARDRLIETQVDHASEVLGRLQRELAELTDGAVEDRGLAVRSETVPGQEMATTLARELEFLISHTVHHYALITVIVGEQGVEAPRGFGMAPSTMKYQQEQAIGCAP